MLLTRLLILCASLMTAVPAFAGNTAITGELAWPSQNDLYGSGVSGNAGDGKKLLEVQWQKLVVALANGSNFIVSGGTLPATDPDLTIQVAAGTAVIDGTYLAWPNTNVTLPASSTSHLFLKIVRGGGLITGLEIEDNTSGVPPASSLKLGMATTSGSAVTATTDTRGGSIDTLEIWTGSGTYTVPAGKTRAKIRVYGAGGGEGGAGGTCDAGGNISGSNGSAGSAGGTTTFGSSVVSANGGPGGSGGGGQIYSGGCLTYPAEGSPGTYTATATGQAVLPGLGLPGGNGNGNGGAGGRGAYAESMLLLIPGATHTITIGAAGTGGNGGANGAGGSGSNGQNGVAGRIVIEYLP